MKFKDFYFTMDIDLKKSVEELYENIDKKIRWSIRKAEKLGICWNLADYRDFEEFCRIYEKYGYVKDIRKEISFVSDGKEGEIMEEGKDNGRLFVAKYEGKLVGGVVTKFSGNESVFSISFVLPEYKNLEVNSYLLWQAIKYSKNVGLENFSLGGISPDAREGTKFHHIFQFKSKWGGEVKKRAIYSKNPFYILGRKLWKKIKEFRGK